jgi:ferric-dicitrate binding protein FerR (iron transport regulator)
MDRHEDELPRDDEQLDDRLREEFGRLRSETEGSARVPDFRAMLEQAKVDAATPDLQLVQGGQSDATERRRRVVRIGGWASAALAAAIAGVLLMGGPSDADQEFERLVAAYSADVSSGAWQSPTSGLLNVPGMNLTRSVPSLGGAIRGLDPDQLPNGPDSETRDL